MKQNIEVFDEQQLQKTKKMLKTHEQRNNNKQMKIKSCLLNELQNELKCLDQLDDKDFKDGKDPYIQDKLLDKLQRISDEAKRLKLYEIQKLSRLAFGRRILNIQLKKKKDQRNLKLLKKEEIQLFFRENRIKRFDYDSLISENMNRSRLIVRANQNGRGFIESQAHFKQFGQALAQCNFAQTIKKVNSIFYGNYTGLNKNKIDGIQILFKIVWIALTLLICLGFAKAQSLFHFPQAIMIVLLCLIMIILLGLSLKIYFEKPSQNNAIQQSVSDVKAYFKQINTEFNLKGLGVQWSCPTSFMYLQVIFHNGFPA